MAAGEVVAAAERDRLAHHLLKRPGLVVDMAQLQQRRPIAWDQKRPTGQQSREHPLLPVVQGVVRTEHHREGHRGGREAACGMGGSQQVLAEQLVQAVLVLVGTPFVAVLFADRQHVGGGVDHSGAGEHVVAGAAFEQLQHDLDVGRVVGGEVVDAVPVGAAQRVAQRLVVGAVPDQATDPGWQLGGGAAAVAHGDVVSRPHQLMHQRPAVELGAAHHQNPHRDHPGGGRAGIRSGGAGISRWPGRR